MEDIKLLHFRNSLLLFLNFFIEDLIVLCEINDDSSMFLPTFSSLVGTVFCFCDWQEFYEPTLTLLQRGNN